MPIMTGIEAIKIIKKLFSDYNSDQMSGKRAFLVRPVIIYFSQYNKHQMKNFITEEEQGDFFLEKPVPETEIRALVKLLNITS